MRAKERRARLSRIIQGQSADVQEYKLGGGGMKNLGAGRRFFTGKVEGTFSRVEVDQFVEQARQEAKMQSAQETERRVMTPVSTALQNIESILDEFSRFRRELFKESEAEVIELIRFLAKKVLHRELATQPEVLKGMVEKALELVEKQKQIVVLFSHADMKFFQSAKADFLQMFSNSTDLRFNADPQMPQGQVLIKTEALQVDVNVDSMIDHLLNQVVQEKVSDKEVNDEGDKA